MLINLPGSNSPQSTDETQGMGEAFVDPSPDQLSSFENALSEMEDNDGFLGQEEMLLESGIDVITDENLINHPKAIPLEQLKPPTTTEIIPQIIAGEAGGSKQISNLNLKSVFKPTPAKQVEEIALGEDQRIQLADSLKVRKSVSIEEQIEQARAQINNNKDSTALQKAKSIEITTSAAILHQIKQQDKKSELEKQLDPQFRAMSDLNPQLKKFEQNFQFDPVIQSTNNSQAQAQAHKQLGPNAPIDRNLSNLNTIFSSVQQEETSLEPSFSDTTIDSTFDNVFTDSLEESYSSSFKETRSVTGANRTSASPFDLDQIMSKVNFKEDGTKEIVIRLYPQHLGELKMKIIQEGNNLAIEMLVGSLEAKQLIDANINELRSHFLEQEEHSFNQLQFAVDVEQYQDSHSESTLEHGRNREDSTAQKQREEIQSPIPISKLAEGRPFEQSGVNSGLNVYV